MIPFSLAYSHSPIVVKMVPAKKTDWPKLQLGSLDTLAIADTPRSLAFTTWTMNSSNSASAKFEKNDGYIHKSKIGKSVTALIRHVNSSLEKYDCKVTNTLVKKCRQVI